MVSNTMASNTNAYSASSLASSDSSFAGSTSSTLPSQRDVRVLPGEQPNASADRKSCCNWQTARTVALVALGIIGFVAGITLALTVNPYCAFICASILLAFIPPLLSSLDEKAQAVLNSDNEWREEEYLQLVAEWNENFGSIANVEKLIAETNSGQENIIKDLHQKKQKLLGTQKNLGGWLQMFRINNKNFINSRVDFPKSADLYLQRIEAHTVRRTVLSPSDAESEKNKVELYKQNVQKWNDISSELNKIKKEMAEVQIRIARAEEVQESRKDLANLNNLATQYINLRKEQDQLANQLQTFRQDHSEQFDTGVFSLPESAKAYIEAHTLPSTAIL